MNPQKMKQMMNQMGIDMDQLGMAMDELDAEEVIIRTADEELVFDAPEVSKIEAQGQETYQVIGSPEVRQREDAGEAFDESDIDIVADRAGVDAEAAKAALEETEGDLAEAISRLQ